MLVVSRKKNEEVVIAPEGHDPIVVTIIEIANGKVRIGIDAARHVPVHRREVYDQLVRDGQLPRPESQLPGEQKPPDQAIPPSDNSRGAD